MVEVEMFMKKLLWNILPLFYIASTTLFYGEEIPKLLYVVDVTIIVLSINNQNKRNNLNRIVGFPFLDLILPSQFLDGIALA
jgi:hypothetical protein